MESDPNYHGAARCQMPKQGVVPKQSHAHRRRSGRSSYPLPSKVASSDKRTTLIFKRLPEGSTRESLRCFLDRSGFSCRYDFLYVPASFKTWAFFGYAFVNFVSHQEAVRCLETLLHDQLCQNGQMEVHWCEEHQGLREHIERYRNSPIMHADVADRYKPVLLTNGVRVPFPLPTKSIRPPRTVANMPC